MKHEFRATTAVAALFAFGAAVPGAALAAEKPKLTLSGYSEQDFGYAENDDLSGFDDSFDQKSDTEVHFNFSTTLDNGLKFSGRIELEGNTSSDQIDENFMRVSGSFGQLTLGSDDNVANGFSIKPPQAGLAVKDIDKWQFDTASGTLLQEYENFSEDAEKISYVTPSFGGFKLGVSYIPTWEQDSNGSPPSKTAQYSEGYALGLGFDRTFGEVGLEAGATYLAFTDGPSAAMAVGDPQYWTVGAKVSVSGFSLGTSYGEADDFFRSEGNSSELEDGYHFQIGAGYETGPWEFTATYHHGEAESKVASVNPANDESDLWVLAAARKLGPGVLMSASLFHADWKGEDADTATSSDDNEGFGGMMRLRVSF
ncbi:MAG: porin [Rhodospirillaceae bacterium]